MGYISLPHYYPLSCAPYVPSNPYIVQKMLEIAEEGPDDIVYDLGYGDGRILFTAIKDFGARRAVGYEINENRFNSVFKEIERQNLWRKIQIYNKDLFKADISDATVITIYLTPWANELLKQKLISETSLGTRIISRSFKISDWKSSKTVSYHSDKIYLYLTNDFFDKF